MVFHYKKDKASFLINGSRPGYCEMILGMLQRNIFYMPFYESSSKTEFTPSLAKGFRDSNSIETTKCFFLL